MFDNTEIPVVSICCITYNHSKFIRDCIQGFLIQKTSFPIEILIFDDASTDNTANILQEFTLNNENIILFLQSENQWKKNKFGIKDWLLPNAKGKYIAFCEGDDYWTDPHKLQKQVDFLESNSTYIGTFHRAHFLNERNGADTC